MSTGFCITGWLAVFFSKVFIFCNKFIFRKMLENGTEVSLVLFYQLQDPYSLDLGRFCTGYGIGVISFVVSGN